MAPIETGLPEPFTGNQPLPLSAASSLLVDLLALHMIGGPALMLRGAARLVAFTVAAQIPCTCGRCPR